MLSVLVLFLRHFNFSLFKTIFCFPRDLHVQENYLLLYVTLTFIAWPSVRAFELLGFPVAVCRSQDKCETLKFLWCSLLPFSNFPISNGVQKCKIRNCELSHKIGINWARKVHITLTFVRYTYCLINFRFSFLVLAILACFQQLCSREYKVNQLP